MPNRVGQQFGNYRLTRLLGKGGFAEVYLGEHFFLKNYAAIKVLFASPTDKQEQDFLFEAQTLARLIHPHIVPIREFAVIRGIPFLAMDYAAGGTLRQRFPRGTCLSLETTVAYVKQIASALQYAHNHNIIHRDIKPENFLLDAQQNLMLSDFGISLFSSSDSQAMAGTLSYMAPEQREGKACFASDQYSLGIVTYEWLCGAPPFVQSVAYQHAYSAPPRLREKDASLPEAVETVVLKVLAKNPHDRFPSVLQFARALEIASRSSTYVIASSDESTSSPDAGIPRKIFLSAHSTEDPFVVRLKADLEARDIVVESSTPDKEGANEAARQTIREAQLVLFVPTSQIQSASAINEYLRVATIYRRKVVCIKATGNAVREPLSGDVTVIDASETHYKQALGEIITLLERERKGTPLSELEPPEQTFVPRNPYKGLSAFTADDAGDFFGREKLVEEIVKSLSTLLQPLPLGAPGKRLLTVIGPSGSGKSSVVMAGLLPRLQEGALPSSETWHYLDPVVPGQHPLDALAHALASRFPDKDMQALRENLGKEAYSIHQLAVSLVHQPKARVVLVIDQFEELFSPTVSELERQQFIALLLTAVTEPRGPLLVLLTLRADFYDRPLSYRDPALGRLIQQQCVVGPMELDDLRAVISKPAAQPDVWLAFEADLVGDLLFDMREQVGALPLLEFTLDQLFQHRQEHLLTLRAYQEIGGVKGALSRHAEDTYAALPSEEHRRLAQVLFLRLITFGAAEQEPIRRRASPADFSFENLGQTRCMQETINTFLVARLLSTNQTAGIMTLEISHEALIREWPRLRDWIREAQQQDNMRLPQILSNDAAEWERLGRPRNRLYPRSQLKELRAWRERNLVSKQEAAFLQASARQQTRVRMRKISIVLLVLLLLIPTIAFTLPIVFASTVTNLNDSGSGSLRQIIDNAKPGSTINFAPWLRGTILLNEPLELTKSITITGPGASILSISFGDQIRGNLNKDFQVDQEVTVNISGMTFKDTKARVAVIVNHGKLTLEHCIISNNETIDLGSSPSGAISNNGTLTLIDSIVSGNIAKGNGATGGGISDVQGTVSLFNSTISNNQAIGIEGGFGGGIASYKGNIILTSSIVSNNIVISAQCSAGGGISVTAGNLTLNTSIISENMATATSDKGNTALCMGNPLSQGFGGGIMSVGSTLIGSNSTISGNSSTGGVGFGGGIFNGGGSLTLSNSTLFSNITTSKGKTTSFGGAIFSGSSMLKMRNSTISGNMATGGLGGTGGGITFDKSSQGTISFCTIYGNKATASGGGIATSTSQVTVKNTIIASNTAGTGPDVSGALISGGYNLIQHFAGATFIHPFHLHYTDLTGESTPDLRIDPQLRNNGGPTLTHALLKGSLAIGQVPHAFCDIGTDQRGVKRPQETACDIGAYEYKSS